MKNRTACIRLIPHKKVSSKKDENNLITLFIPRFQSQWATRIWTGWFRGSPFISLHLDEIGSFFWEQCDGERSLEQIGEKMREQFGNKVEPVFDRLMLFAHMLWKRDAITLMYLEESER